MRVARFRSKSNYQPDEDTLVAMRIHGVSPEYMQQLKTDGYDHIDLQKLIAFRIHGVSPEFISQMQSRGMKDLTIDKLVSLRIHGID